MLKQQIATVMIAIVLMSGCVWAEVITCDAAQDGFGTTRGNLSEGNGTGTQMNVYDWDETQKSYIQFDLDALDGYQGGAVESATMKLYANHVQDLNNAVLKAYLIDDSWDESLIDGTTTYLPDTGAHVTTTDVDGKGWCEVDITSAVKDWLDGTQDNYGIALTGSRYDTRLIKFATTESGYDGKYHPKLAVTVPEPATIGIFATGGILAMLKRKRR